MLHEGFSFSSQKPHFGTQSETGDFSPHFFLTRTFVIVTSRIKVSFHQRFHRLFSNQPLHNLVILHGPFLEVIKLSNELSAKS